MSTSLRHAITSFTEQLQHRQQERRTQRIAATRAEQDDTNTMAPIPLSPDVRAFFNHVAQSVQVDRQRYHIAVASSNGEAALPAAVDIPPAAVASPLSIPELPDSQDAAALALASVAPGPHLHMLWDEWARHERLLPSAEDSQSTGRNPCASLLLAELNRLTQDTSAKPAMAISLIGKTKQSVQSFLDGRTNDAVTLLKNALHTDPHNHSILMALSQISYWLATKGVQNILPEAREFAQRSTIYSEKQTPSQMALYQYTAIVTESAFGPERTLEWLRDSGMLETDAFSDRASGLLTERGIYLRAWYLLSLVPVELWQDAEFVRLRNLVTKVIGGATIYLMWFRTPLLTAASLGKDIPILEDIEKLVHSAYRLHSNHYTAFQQLNSKNGEKPWLLRVRFLNAVKSIISIPAFDQAALHFSLDGHSWDENVSPDPELRATTDLRELSYWRLWCLVLTPFKDIRQPYLMPAEETASDLSLLASCEELLTTLATTERNLIKAHLWDDLKPWLVRWHMEHLLAASTGSNKPRGRFAPSLPPYTSLYRVWQDPPISSLLPSEIIAENARRGAFASFFEITAALEGANRLINDPVHGLVASQKRASAAANRYNPKKFKTVAQEFGGSGGSGLLMLLMPVGLLGLMAAVITFSANWGQALGLMLALAGVAGVVALNLKK
jgi:hypothetical protein